MPNPRCGYTVKTQGGREEFKYNKYAKMPGLHYINELNKHMRVEMSRGYPE